MPVQLRAPGFRLDTSIRSPRGRPRRTPSGSPGRVSFPTALLARLANFGNAGLLVGPTADVVRTAGWRATLERRRSRAQASAWPAVARRRVYRQIWEDAARHHEVELLDLPGDFMLIGPPGRRTLVFDQKVMLDYAATLELALDKSAVHALLDALGLPTARSVQFDTHDREAGLDFLASTDGPCVVKPRDSAGGDAVTCGVRTAEHFERARLWARRRHSRMIIEEQAAGNEYRFLFLEGTLLDVIVRYPPRVVGDGRSSISELIAIENQRRSASEDDVAIYPLDVDLDCLLTLECGGWSLRSVPAPGQAVIVKTSTNQAAAEQVETISLDVVGNDLTRDARAAARATGLRLAGVELITGDLSMSLREAGGIVVEVNGTPGLHYHYLVADRQRAVRVARPVLAALLDPNRTNAFPPYK